MVWQGIKFVVGGRVGGRLGRVRIGSTRADSVFRRRIGLAEDRSERRTFVLLFSGSFSSRPLRRAVSSGSRVFMNNIYTCTRTMISNVRSGRRRVSRVVTDRLGGN